MSLIIAIDGPAGSGKSTVARTLASRLGLPHLDTGAVYRTAALRALQSGADLDDEVALVVLCEPIQLGMRDGRLTIDGCEPGSEIRSPAVGMAASHLSVHRRVRKVLVAKQHRWLEEHGGVAEGRDIGTVVAPEALLKLFVTATPEERARRRLRDHADEGHEVNLETLAAEIAARDERDASRAASPLRPADDAIIVDTTGREVEDVVAEALGVLAARGLTG